MSKTVDVRARITSDEKQRASETLADMGLTVSQAIRLFLNDVAENQSLPFQIKAPNRQTLAAINELERGEGRRYDILDDMLSALNKD